MLQSCLPHKVWSNDILQNLVCPKLNGHSILLRRMVSFHFQDRRDKFFLLMSTNLAERHDLGNYKKQTTHVKLSCLMLHETVNSWTFHIHID